MRAFYRIDVDLGFAVRTFLGGGGCFRFRPAEHIDALYYHKNGKSDDQKLDHGLDKGTVSKNGGRCLGCIQSGIGLAVQCDEEIGEIYLTGSETDDRHQDVIDERVDDVAERSADNDTDCHIHDIAAHDEFFEFFCDLTHAEFLLLIMDADGFLCGIDTSRHFVF